MKNSEKISKAFQNGTLNTDDVLKAAEAQMFGMENDGFCTSCGNQQGGCEPDARNYECEECGERAVFGAAELMMYAV